MRSDAGDTRGRETRVRTGVRVGIGYLGVDRSILTSAAGGLRSGARGGPDRRSHKVGADRGASGACHCHFHLDSTRGPLELRQE